MFRILFCFLTFSFILFVGFADASLQLPPIPSMDPIVIPDDNIPCDECGGDDDATHYDVTYYTITCPDCGHSWTDYSLSENGSTSCTATDSPYGNVY